MANKKTPAKKPTETDEDQETQEQEGQDSEGDQDTNPEDENRRINAIVTNRVKREMKGVLSQLTQMQELIKSMSTAKKPEGEEEDDEDTTPKKPVEDPKAAKRLNRLEKELAEARDAQKKAEQARAEESDKARRNEMRNLFQSALAEHGVTDPRLMRAALDQLEQDGYMLRDEDGKVKFKGQDKYGIETNFDPKTGVKSWIQQEGKSFVPAVDAGGSGSGPARNGQANPNMSKGEFGKLTPAQKAAIEIDRASQGLPPLE